MTAGIWTCLHLSWGPVLFLLRGERHRTDASGIVNQVIYSMQCNCKTRETVFLTSLKINTYCIFLKTQDTLWLFIPEMLIMVSYALVFVVKMKIMFLMAECHSTYARSPSALVLEGKRKRTSHSADSSLSSSSQNSSMESASESGEKYRHRRHKRLSKSKHLKKRRREAKRESHNERAPFGQRRCVVTCNCRYSYAFQTCYDKSVLFYQYCFYIRFLSILVDAF